jgi:hypothetical protein
MLTGFRTNFSPSETYTTDGIARSHPPSLRQPLHRQMFKQAGDHFCLNAGGLGRAQACAGGGWGCESGSSIGFGKGFLWPAAHAEDEAPARGDGEGTASFAAAAADSWRGSCWPAACLLWLEYCVIRSSSVSLVEAKMRPPRLMLLLLRTCFGEPAWFSCSHTHPLCQPEN